MTMEPSEIVAKSGKTDAAAKILLKSREKNCMAAANKQLVPLELELAQGKTLHALLGTVEMRSKANGINAQTDIQEKRKILNRIEIEAKLVTGKLEEVERQFAETVKAAVEALH